MTTWPVLSVVTFLPAFGAFLILAGIGLTELFTVRIVQSS